MLTGAHAIIYSSNVGLPPAEMAVHPAKENGGTSFISCAQMLRRSSAR
jgi:hypothetical protein